MANFASALKDEISRIARREIRQQTAGAIKSVAQCEREIAALKRQVQELQLKLSSARAQAAPKPAASKKSENKPAASKKAASKPAESGTAASGTAASGKAASSKAASSEAVPKGKSTKAASAAPAKKSIRTRFSAKGLKATRERLGLSADNFGKLVGVSGLSIYNWEQGKARPRESSVEALLKIKGLGKREAANRLQTLESSTAKKGASASAGRAASAS
jgi:DNA-binding transcriptional regulator YiaG